MIFKNSNLAPVRRESFRFRYLYRCFLLAALLAISIPKTFSQPSNHKLLKQTEVYNSKEELLSRYDRIDIGNNQKVASRESLKLQHNPSARQSDVSAIPKELNAIVVSPDGKHFVAYEEQEGTTPFIFFYNINGELLNKAEVNIYPNVKYSQHGKYVEVFNAFGKEFMVYTREGKLVQDGDYIDLIQDNQEVLYNLFVSDDGKNMLFSTSSKVHLFSFGKQKKWDRPSSAILDCRFVEGGNTVSLKTSSQVRDKINPFDLEILSEANGQLLDSINKVSAIDFIESKVIVGKNSKFYEYEIKR